MRFNKFLPLIKSQPTTTFKNPKAHNLEIIGHIICIYANFQFFFFHQSEIKLTKTSIKQKYFVIFHSNLESTKSRRMRKLL